jgi:flagellar assembly protein FliH
MSDNAKPFAFDREFAPDGTVLRDGDAIRRVLTEDEAQAMAASAAEQARASEEAEAARASAEALRQVSAKLQALIAQLNAESEALREDAARLAVAAARAIAGKALEQYGAETIEACAKEALTDLRAEPRIAVRVAPTSPTRSPSAFTPLRKPKAWTGRSWCAPMTKSRRRLRAGMARRNRRAHRLRH